MAFTCRPIEYPDAAKIELTNTGFQFGPLKVDRMCTLPKGGGAVRLETPKIALTVRFTKSGKIRVYTDSGIELMVSK